MYIPYKDFNPEIFVEVFHDDSKASVYALKLKSPEALQSVLDGFINDKRVTCINVDYLFTRKVKNATE